VIIYDLGTGRKINSREWFMTMSYFARSVRGGGEEWGREEREKKVKRKKCTLGPRSIGCMANSQADQQEGKRKARRPAPNDRPQ